MTAGSIAAALLLLAWSQVTELWQLYAVWIAMGATFSCVLYEPVFAVMARELKDDYRRGIITHALGGLASTAFIPLTQFLSMFRLASGARGPCRHSSSLRNPCSLVCAGNSTERCVTKAAVPAESAQGDCHAVFWLLALSYGAHAFMFMADLPHHPRLTERGFALPMISGAYSWWGRFRSSAHCVFALEKRIDVKFAGLMGRHCGYRSGLLMLATPGSRCLFFAISMVQAWASNHRAGPAAPEF